MCYHSKTMIRTSIVLTPALHQRLKMAADYESRTLTEVINNLLDTALESQEQVRLQRTYQALKKVQGICKADLSDASSTIDNVLYGENGAWQGQPDR